MTRIRASGYLRKKTPVRTPAASRVEYALFTLLVMFVSKGDSAKKLGTRALAEKKL